MMSIGARLESGGRIDRSRPLNFTFNGRNYTGYQGDTLASALIANGIHLTSRSFRYHRPRGIFSAGIEECHALVSVGVGRSCESNVRATRQWLYEGLVANSQNGWPSVQWDLGALPGWFSRFLPTGFYYKTFMWPHWKWYENMVRKLAGIASAPSGHDPDRYDKQNAHCDLLIIGAGPAGLAAALSAAQSGLRVILADDHPEFGGSLLWSDATIENDAASDWVRRVTARLEKMENVRLLPRTLIVAAWDHGYFTAVEQRTGEASRPVTQRLWKIRSRNTLLASGAIERSMVFPDNDRPGIMLADSARQYVNRFAVRPGNTAVIFTNNDSAYQTALDLHTKGVTVKAIVDVRADPDGPLMERLRSLGIDVYAGYAIIATRGYFRLSRVYIRPVAKTTNPKVGKVCLSADLLCVSGGWNPTVHLLTQAGGKLEYDPELACFVPRRQQPACASTIQPIGSANRLSGLSACLADGHAAGLSAIEQLTGKSFARVPTPTTAVPDQPYGIKPAWQTSPPCAGRQWVDYLHDVTSHSIETAAIEGYVSVEHLKRYTTIGMGIDQGKTANVNALAILGEVTGRSMAKVGTTTFRPPYHPVTLGALAGREIGKRAWPLRRLPLHDWHVEAGGVMEDHGGWHRAAYYPRIGETEDQAIKREVLAARNGVTLFDSSSLGKLEVRGPDAAAFLNRMYINNVETLNIGQIRYGMMLNENGIIIDDGVFARLEDDFFLVSTSSAGTADVALAFEEWLQTEWPELNVLVNNATTQWATVTVGGPRSRAVICSLLSDQDLGAELFPHMTVLEGTLEGIPYRLMRVSFTGELSYELNVPAGYALSVWQRLWQLGKPFEIEALGMEALDVLRTEKGFLEVGVDTDISTSPLDVGWALPISKKSADFIGKRSLKRPNDIRPNRLQLVGLKPLNENQVIPAGSHILARTTNEPEGHVTSSCLSPTLGYSIAMAMLKSGKTRQGERIVVDVDGKHHEAEVVPLGFYDPTGERLRSD